MRPKVFLSSTFSDLVALRASVATSLEYWGYEPIFFESDNFPKKPNLRADDMCLEAVKQCHLFLLAIDKNYGSPYKGEDLSLYGISVTEAEAKVAFECHKEVFPFVRRNTWEQWKVYGRDKKYKSPDVEPRVFEFIDWVIDQRRDNWIDAFHDVEELKRKLRPPRLQQSSLAPDLVYVIPLEGCAKMLDESLLSRKASKDEILEFYKGAPLKWKVIAADGDVRREQEHEIFELTFSSIYICINRY